MPTSPFPSGNNNLPAPPGMGTQSPVPPSMQVPQQFQQPDPLAELREIHMPEAIPDWPPAGGWWILGFLFILLVGGLTTALIQRYRKRAYLRYSLKALAKLELDFSHHSNGLILSDDLALLLKRICLTQHPRHQVAGLSGDAWLQFLDKTGNTNEFTQGCGAVLGHGRFQKGAAANINGQELLTLTRRWIKQQ